MGNYIQKFTGFLAFLLVLASINSQAQTNISGNITSNTTWSKANSPYVLTGSIGISNSTTLTIEAGVEVIRNGDFTILINGVLTSIGTISDSIKFTSNVNSPSNYFIDFQKTNLTNSRLNFVKYSNSKSGNVPFLRIGNESEGNESSPKNSGDLILDNSSFSGTYLLTKGYSTTANLRIKNSIISGSYLMGAYPRTEPIIIENTTISNSTLNSDSYNYGITLKYCVNNSNSFLMGCCGANFTLENSKFIDCNFGGRGDYGQLDITKSVFINTPINYPSSTVNLTSSVFKSDKNNLTVSGSGFGSSMSGIEALISIGGGTISNTNISSSFYYGLKFNSGNSNIVNSTFSNSPSSIYFSNFSAINLNNINFSNIKDYFLYNNSTKPLTISNSYFNGLSGINISGKIFDYNNDLNKGVITFNDNQVIKIINTPISYVSNILKTIVDGRVLLTWSANTESDVSGYKIYYGGYTGYSYTNVIDAGNVLTYTLPAGVSIDEDIAVTAYDASKDGTDDQFDGNESWYSPANKAPAIAVISTITPTERQVQLTWGAVTNANKYNIYKSTDSSTFTLLTSVTGTTYTDASLNTLQQRYYYKVAAFDSLDLSYDNYGLEGPHSAIKGAKPTNKPTISSVESFTDVVKLNFTYNSNLAGITNVKVYRSSPTQARALIATLAASATTFTNTVTNDIPYSYDVTILNATDESDPSLIKSASGFSIPKLNSTYHNKFDFTSTDTIKWQKNSLATRYQIQIDTVTTFNSNVLVTSTPTDTFFTSSTLPKDKYLYWRVRSGDINGYSSWSNFNIHQIASKTATIDSIYSYTGQIKIKINPGSYLGVDSIFVYRSSENESRNIIAKLGSKSVYFTDEVTNGIKYIYDITVKNQYDQSKISNSKSASGFSISSNLSPTNNQLDIKESHLFKWTKVSLASSYLLEFDTLNSFNSGALIQKSLSDTSLELTGLIQNQYYFWRIKSGDANGYSNWNSTNTFQSYIKEATIDNVIAANKNDTLKFTIPSIKNISKIYILRDTVDNPVKIIDSISNVTSIANTYNDTIQLKLNQKYFYSIQLFNSQGVKSAYATSKNATPFNTKPKTATLENKVFDNVGEYNFVRSTYSSLGSKDLDGKIVNYNWYVNDSLVNSTDSILIYYYNQGTNDLKLVITDNDGAKDSTTAKVTLNAFLKTFKGGLLGGVTALNPNKIYTADSTFDPVNGASILMLDRLGNTIYPLVVSSKIFTTPSVSSDSSVFITSGSSLNGFSKTGAPLWSTIPLGGNSFVTPTIDSLLTRIYLGVSNKNFFAIDYNTGKVAWNILSDAPINTSAVITGDRKLVFISQLGTLYGYDIRTNIAHTASKWKYSIGEIVSKSPAVDGGNNLYIGTDAGNLVKLTLKEDSSVMKVWSIKLKGAIQTSAVIDGDGFVYIGDEVGDFYKINPNDGSIIWTYSSGAAIRSTPAISDFGSIYFANMNGLVTAIDSNKSIKWKYKDPSPISANLLYINNMIYAGTESGKFFAIFDNPTSKTVNTTLSVAGTETISKVSNIKSFSTTEISVPKVPIWGTFQGNYRRTGSRNFDCPDKPIIKIPSCAQNADSIRVSTDNMKQRYWLLNEVKLETIDTVLFIKPSDKIKLIAYNSNGCNVSSVETAAIPNSDVPKPIIVTNTGTDKFCQTDSIIMSSKLNAKSYQWNYAGFPISNAKSKTLVTNLSGAYSVTLVNDYGCKSTSDISLIMAIQKPNAPSISRDTSGSLISSSVTGNQWYKEGIAISGATSRLFKPSSPGIFNVSSNNQGCMSTLSTPYYFIVTNVINLGSNEFIKLAPNPVKNQINIDFIVKGYQRLNIDFYEISTGLLKYSNKGVFAGSQLFIGQLSPGTYVVSVRSDDGKVSHKLKIVKL